MRVTSILLLNLPILKELFIRKEHRDRQRARQKKEERDNVFGNKAVKIMFNEIEQIFGRGLSSTEISQILEWLGDYNATPEVVLFAIKYCTEKNKTSLKVHREGGKRMGQRRTGNCRPGQRTAAGTR